MKEKEVLLKEVHHRVKNNMQVISSLLDLQASRIEDPAVNEALKDSRSRVRAMAIIHESLYQSDNMSEINLKPYLRKLAANLFRTYNTSPANITLKIDAEDVLLDIDQAIPCGLVLNELISNSLKYAFPEDRRGEISLNVHPDAGRKRCAEVRGQWGGIAGRHGHSQNGNAGSVPGHQAAGAADRRTHGGQPGRRPALHPHLQSQVRPRLPHVNN